VVHPETVPSLLHVIVVELHVGKHTANDGGIVAAVRSAHVAPMNAVMQPAGHTMGVNVLTQSVGSLPHVMSFAQMSVAVWAIGSAALDPPEPAPPSGELPPLELLQARRVVQNSVANAAREMSMGRNATRLGSLTPADRLSVR
jgi:hypothetical protein